MTDLKAYSVWDASVRWFHWINLLCVLGLIAVGVIILNAKVLGVPSDRKILLKTVHVWIGYEYGVANCQSGCPESVGYLPFPGHRKPR